MAIYLFDFNFDCIFFFFLPRLATLAFGERFQNSFYVSEAARLLVNASES